MSDYLGNIPVPEIVVSGVFPIVPDFPHGRAHAPEVVVHQFGSANAKIEQRFLLGTGAKRFTVRRARLKESDRIALRDFWDNHYGPYGAFYYDAPNDDGNGTTRYTCRFENEPLSWEMVSDAVCSVGVTLAEIPTTSPTYSLNETLSRFPSSALAAALLSQVQELIPLVKIQPLQAGYPAIFVSDRRCTIGSQLYQARLVEFDGIAQSIGNEADEAQFSFGNADRVLRDLSNDVDLFRASIEFSLFHVSTGIKLDLWKGNIVNWSMDSGPDFRTTAADGLYELNLPYPTRRISRICWKQFDDGNGCPFSTQGAMDLVHFPSADSTKCDKGYETPNGCLAHGMKRYFGGIIAEPQGVRIKDNSTGTWGFGRSSITSVSLVADSIYDEVLPEIYTDADMPVNSKIAAGRDESDFYEVLGIVGEGPLGAFGSGHKLDGQFHHGYPGSLGLRQVLGTDPAGAQDWFSLDESGDQTGGDWRKVFSGNSTYKDNFAAGTAFLVIRRSDAKGIQLSRLGEHSMQAIVSQGMSGWAWTAPGVRSQQVLTNPIWIAVNILLRARGLRFADAATAEQYFDVDAAVAAAAICDQQVDRLVGTGLETQFKFRGVLQEEKPLRDWIQEILMNCLGYYSFAFGKLKVGIRVNSSVVEPFTVGNILFQSLQLAPLRPSFNHLTANFADEEFQFVNNSISLYDIDHAKLIGGAVSPLFLKSNVNLSGTASKSQAARLITTRLREELGGITAAEWKAARQISFRTTVLALNTEPGMVCSMTHPDMPGGSGEFRVTSWRLNKDFSIDIQGRTTTDSMYDLVIGPKPADVPAAPVPVEFPPIPAGQVWHPNEVYPPAGDPLFGADEGNFGLQQKYNTLADSTAQATLAVTGALPVNDLIPDTPAPAIHTVSATGGGLLPAGTYYIAICVKNSAGKFSPPSNIVAVEVPANGKVTLSDLVWPAGTFSGYVVFGATDPQRLCKQIEVSGALPASIDVTVAFLRSTWNMPNPKFWRLRAKAKVVFHAGVFGAPITAVAANKITASDLIDATDNWNARDVSVIADKSDGSAPIWDFHVTAYDQAMGEMTVTPDPQAAGVEVGDVLIIRAAPSAATATTVSDPGFINREAPAGLNVNEEEGRVVRIIAGLGRGQVRRIVSNTATQLTIDKPWDTIPDSTSRFIVEAAAWDYIGESTPTRNPLNTVTTELQIPVDNMLKQTMLVAGVSVDVDGTEAPEDKSPLREVYLFGDVGNTDAFAPNVIISIDGTLAIGSDLAPMVSLGVTQRATGVRCLVKQAPTGADLTFAIYVGGTLWMTLTIPAGQTSVTATQAQLDAAADIAADANIRVDITAVGTTFPGADASVQIRL